MEKLRAGKRGGKKSAESCARRNHGGVREEEVMTEREDQKSHMCMGQSGIRKRGGKKKYFLLRQERNIAPRLR